MTMTLPVDLLNIGNSDHNEVVTVANWPQQISWVLSSDMINIRQ